MAHMRKVSVVGQIVDAHPRYRLLVLPICDQLLHTRPVRTHHRLSTRNVTAGTHLNGRNARVDRAVCGGMTVHAGDLVRPASVQVVSKCDGLVRRVSASLDLHIGEGSNQDGDQCECGGGSQQSELRSTHHAPNVCSNHSAFCAPVHPRFETLFVSAAEHMCTVSSAQGARMCAA